MTVRRVDDTVLLEDICPVDDAEILMQELQAGAALIDWSGCTHLHTACLQVILVAGVPMRGQPANPLLTQWVSSLLLRDAAPDRQNTAPDPETACLMEA